MVAGVPNVKPKAGVVNVVVVAESDGVLVGDDDEMELESEVDAESEEVVDSEVDAESEVEGKSEPVGIGMVPMVLASSTFPGEVVVVPVPVAAAQSVSDTVTVDTTVTVTMLSVPMATVGVTIPFVPE